MNAFQPLAAAVTAFLLAAAASSALAQDRPLTLPPPSLTDPAVPADAGATRPRAAKKPARRAAAKEADDPTKLKRSRKTDPDFTQSEAMRQQAPRRFVPEEFDTGGAGDDGRSPRPYMSPTGRAGMGMRF